MESSNKWVFAYAYNLIRSAKLSLVVCAILSLAYSYALYSIGSKVQFSEFGHLTVLSLGAGGVLLFKFLTQLYANFTSIKLSAWAQFDVIKDFEERLLYLKNYLNDSQILHRLTVDFTQFSESLIQGIIQVVIQGLITLFIGGYLIFEYQKELPQILIFLLLGLSLSGSLHVILRFLTQKKASVDADVFRFQKNIITGSDYLIVSKRFSSWVLKYKQRLVQQVRQDKKISILQHSSSTLNWGARYIFILIIISPLVAAQSLSPVSIYWLYILLGLSTQLFWTLFHFGQVRVYAERARKIIKRNNRHAPVKYQEALRVDARDLNLFFGPSQKECGVRGLKFSWHATDRVWIEGASGAGKTTLLKAIVGLHYNFDGSLTVPSKNFKVGYLSQDPFFFDGESLGDNLNVDSINGGLKEVADRLCLTSFFESIEWNLEKTIGSEGMVPSRGQRVRLGLLRELLQKPDLLLLDEPSANLDIKTAQEMMMYLGEISLPCITVICEHKVGLKNFFNPTKTLSI